MDKYIREELLKIHNDINRVVNVLVEYLYGEERKGVKTTLWDSFGDVLVSNIRENVKGTKQCEGCGVRIEIVWKNHRYCSDCSNEIEREKTKERVRRHRKNM